VIRINLAPPRARQSFRGFRLEAPGFNLGLMFLLLYVVAVAGIGVYWWQLSRQEAALTAELDTAKRELQMLDPITTQAAKVREQLGEMEKRVKTITELTRDQSKPTRIFEAFASVVPSDLWITKMEERGNTLKVSGNAFSASAVSDLMANLRASGKFKEVDIVVSRQELTKTPRLVDFEVTCRFES
jgi:type IV pilus assembly protein PilN